MRQNVHTTKEQGQDGIYNDGDEQEMTAGHAEQDKAQYEGMNRKQTQRKEEEVCTSWRRKDCNSMQRQRTQRESTHNDSTHSDYT